MITVVSGKIGEGKSYWLVKLIKDHVLRGGVVATNMVVFPDVISKNFHRKLSPRQFIKIAPTDDPRKIPRGDFRGTGRRRVLVILDEALNWFASSGASSDPRRLTWGEWLRQSDKLGQDVFFVAQNFDRAAKWIRELAARLIFVSNLRNFRFLHLPLGRWLGLENLSFVRSVDVKSGLGLGFEVMHLTPRIWTCYRTAELFGFESSDNAYDGLVVYPPAHFPKFAFVLPAVVLFWGLWCYVSA